MNEIKVAENKTLKLTNVLSREIRGDEMANMPLVVTQMYNFIKSSNAQPIGPLVQAITITPDHEFKMYLMQQATQLIAQMDPGYHGCHPAREELPVCTLHRPHEPEPAGLPEAADPCV